MDSKKKETVSTGKLRVKGNAVFALPSDSRDGRKPEEAGGGGDRESIKKAIAQRIRSKTESDTGGERIGDVSKKSSSSSEVTIRFDKDDDHYLSGIAVIKPDTQKKGGLWVGRYDDEKRKRWRFEMRKVEE
jgi:hypothetical protein